LRVSIHREIVSALNLVDNDYLTWKLSTKNDIPFLVVEKVEDEGTE